MANVSLLQAVNQTTTPGSWEAYCIAALNSSNYDWRTGLVDGHGHPTTTFTSSTWGITLQTCQDLCNSSVIPFAEAFNFQSFAASMTNYYLPWLALTAQLPFETGDPWSNIMAFCLAVGSPAMVTYSLTITILNRFWVRKNFKGLREKARGVNIKQRYDRYSARIGAAQYLLQEAQQVPLRASQEKGWLSSLIVIPHNDEWWEHLEGRLKGTRRGLTASLVAQMLLAIIAYLFTVISSFRAELGDPTTALQIASGSLWIWLIPVILGWITVGTQYNHHSIEDALGAEAAHRAPDPPEREVYEEQRGLIVRSGLTPQPHRVTTVVGANAGPFDTPDFAQLKVPSWAGAGVEGDEQQKGPIYNYARLFTWWQLANTLNQTLDQTLDNVKDGKVCQSRHHTGPTKWEDQRGPDNLVGDMTGTANYCGLQRAAIKAYPKWSEMPPEVYRRIFAAIGAALFVQWGTTGASILIAYDTPTVGLGCRSGGYTFYGGLGTLAWLLLLISMLLSHEVMLRYQAAHFERPTINFALRGDGSDPNQYTRSFVHGAIAAAAVITRYVGKFVAFANTIWLIASSIFEFINLYDNCWCKGNAFGMGDRGWIVLFKNSTDLALSAASPWGGGLAMTLTVCAVSYTFFAMGSMKGDDD